ELDAARGALEQAHAEQLLERLDLLAHRLLGDVQLAGGTGEAAELCDCDEVTHLPKVRRGVQHCRVYDRMGWLVTSRRCSRTTTCACSYVGLRLAWSASPFLLEGGQRWSQCSTQIGITRWST